MATLKGVFPEPKVNRRKNFIHENVKNLRRMEHYFHSHKEVEEFQKLHIQRHQKAPDKYQNVTSRVNSSLRETKNDQDFTSKSRTIHYKTDSGKMGKPKALPNFQNSVPVLQNKTTKGYQKGLQSFSNNDRKSIRLKKGSRDAAANKKIPNQDMKAPSDSNLCCEHSHSNNPQAQYRSQGIQTVDDKHISNLYAEGTIRYPTRRSPRIEASPEKTKELGQQTDVTPREGAISPSDRGDVSPARSSPSPKLPDIQFGTSPDEGTDFIKLNKQRTSIAAKMATQLNNGVPPTNYRKGVVPKYDVKNISENEKRHNSRRNKRQKKRHPILTVQRDTFRCPTVNARKPFVC
ncbi:uncharacterized protein LOC105690241 isoform X2 [Athalia rosae]|uniref:uncharacterized protein LOC105690241 isoform X2 n=1 Tax=Athalia rosae TaxID=37344 RepID=UPI002033EDE3|nr:uncharacterized protein LOC105690241 isoform X2 [Athalia rosae]